MYMETLAGSPAGSLYHGRLGLSTDVDGRSAALSTLQNVEAGEAVFAEGDAADSIYEVVGGILRLSKLLPDGRRQVTGFLSRGNLLGLAPEGFCVYTAEAITPVRLRRYRRAAFERLVADVPGFARHVLAVASHEMRAAQDQMMLLGRKSASERLASFLLRMAEMQGVEDEGKLALPMTRTDIADHLGLTIETVSRTLSKLRRDRLIDLPDTGHVVLLDRDLLEDLAAGDTDQD
jgi:CRP/FNR family transcriptional regulator